MTVAIPLTSLAFLAPSATALENTINGVASATGQIAAGNRVLSISDQVAATSVSAGLQSQNASLKAATQSIAQGITLLQVASVGLSTISDILSNMQTIAAQANTLSLTDNQRAFLSQQFTESLNNIDSIASATSFNGLNVLDGSLSGGVAIKTGPQPGANATIAIDSAQTSALFGNTLPDIATQADAADAQAALTDANNNLQGIVSHVNAQQTGLAATAASLNQSLAGVASATNSLTNTNADDVMRQLQRAITADTAIAVVAQTRTLPSSLLKVLRPVHTAPRPAVKIQKH